MFARHIALVTALGALVATGTVITHRGVEASPVSPRVTNADSGWTATLSAPSSYAGDEHVFGSATVSPDKSGKGFTAKVNIAGATPKSTHPWHVHKGTCGNDQGVVGGGSSYTPITVGDDGKGTSSAKVSAPLDPGGSYMVNIHASPTDMKTIVACGPLTKQ
ncbi:MAG TPA: hypothetical protein VF102_05570 [Gemmatimonadaceae bacterium]|jgi:hypothetical protein